LRLGHNTLDFVFDKSKRGRLFFDWLIIQRKQNPFNLRNGSLN
jgi:hypothetical protein